MNTYKVKDQRTGKIVVLKGDSPPTEQELEQVFSSINQPAEDRILNSMQPTPIRDRPKSASEAVVRLAKDTMEAFAPPTTIEAAKRAISPLPGQYGLSRTGQDISEYGKEDLNKLAEGFVQKPFMRDYPKTAAAIATGGSITGEMLMPSPRDMALAVGANPLIKKAIAAEMAVRGVGKTIGKKLISIALPPSEEAVAARFKNPAAFKVAENKEYLDIANEATGTLSKLSDKITKADGNAWKTLSNSESISKGGVSKEQLINDLQKTVESLKVEKGDAVGSAQEKAIGVLQKIKDNILKVGEQPVQTKKTIIEYDTSDIMPKRVEREVLENGDPLKTGISERSLKDTLKQLDANINWDDPAAGPVNDALESLRSSWDGILKTKNPGYEKAMRPVASMTRTLTKSQRLLGISNPVGEGFQPGNQTEGILKNLSGQTRGEARKTLGKLKQLTGSDIPAQAKLQNLADQFKGGKTQGSRRVNLAGIIGTGVGALPGILLKDPVISGLGGMFGTSTGALLGAAIDTQGGKFAGSMIDRLARMPKYLQPGTNNQRLAISQLLELAGKSLSR